ncbi:MAG: hypothetical protein JOZ37_01525, partial [Actinobacteria bacterium]|nr:hypothetical protein [Actinomycetota bacterium]
MWAWRGLAGLFIFGVPAGAAYVLRTDVVARALTRAAIRRPITWLVGVPALVGVLVVGGPFVYLQSITSTNPKALTFADLGPSPASGGGEAAAAADAPVVATSTTVAVAGGPASTVPGTTRASTLANTQRVAGILTGTWKVGHNTQARYGVDDTVMGQ